MPTAPDPCSVLRALLTHGHSYALSALAPDPDPSAGPDDATGPPWSARYGFPTDPFAQNRAFATLDEAVGWLAEAATEQEPDGEFARWLSEYNCDP